MQACIVIFQNREVKKDLFKCFPSCFSHCLNSCGYFDCVILVKKLFLTRVAVIAIYNLGCYLVAFDVGDHWVQN